MAKLFGDEVAVYEADLHVDHNTHELVVEEHDTHVHRVATEAGVPTDAEKANTAHVNAATAKK